MTKIEWTDETWNPVTGCNKVSQGCKNCYAEIMHRRLMVMFPKKYTKPFLTGPELHADELTKPYRWNKPRRVFVNSMSDLFHEDIPFDFIQKLFLVMLCTPQHTYQVLTKRASRMVEWFDWIRNSDRVMYEALEKDKNIWKGVSVEDQSTSEERIPKLLLVPGIKFLSCEPLLGPIDIERLKKGNFGFRAIRYLNWIIVGGESGHNARPMHPDWARSLRDQCEAGGVPFFFKQWGEYIPNGQFHCEEMDLNKLQKWKMTGGVTFFRGGKSKTGNFLDQVQHLNFPHASAQL